MSNTDAFEIVPVTRANQPAFIRLLEEQADILEPQSAPTHIPQETADRLVRHLNAPSDPQCRAFMVYDHDIGAPVTAVTYYDCWTPYGAGVYLEDIVTTDSQRGRGHGKFALSALASMALQNGYESLRWECAASNEAAQGFYDRRGGERMQGRQTWRATAPAEIPAEEMQLLHPVSNPRDALYFGIAAAQVTRNGAVCLDALYGRHGATVAAAQYYRSYSTFNARAGLHVENIVVPDQRPSHLHTFLTSLWARRRSNWGGHFDITVTDSQRWMEPALEAIGFEPLTYGQGVMVPRVMRADAMRRLAQGYAPRPSARACALA